MTFLAPFGLIGLVSVPVLLWAWRLSSTHRQVRVPSLIPFEQLLRRAPKRRTHLVTNALFWMQLAALLGLTLALMQPMMRQRRASTTLVVLDTSASMGALLKGSSALARAKGRLGAWLAGKPATAQVLIMTTSPVAALLPQPTSDGVALTRALRDVRVSDLGGNLSTTQRIGRALLGMPPDETWLVTDEPAPAAAMGEHVRFASVGEPAANAAIVGIDAQGTLCSGADARVIVTVQNFSNQGMSLALTAMQDRRRLAGATVEASAHGRQAVPLALPAGTSGLVEVSLEAAHDSLARDNHAWVDVRPVAALPIVVRSEALAFTQTVSTWLNACKALTWGTDMPAGHDRVLVIADGEGKRAPAVAASMVFLPPASAQPIRSRWVVSSDHPVGAYLPPLEVVAASLNLAPEAAAAGMPVIAALTQGRRVPVVIANERDGRRELLVRLSPIGSEGSAPVVLAFLNGLRWLMGSADVVTAGEALLLNGFTPGTVQVRRPDGSVDLVQAGGNTVRYDKTILAGRYEFSQGARRMTAGVNLLDPLESNLLERASTWRPLQEPPGSPRFDSYAAQPLSHPVVMVLVLLLLAEWWRYAATQGAARPPLPSRPGTRGSRTTRSQPIPEQVAAR